MVHCQPALAHAAPALFLWLLRAAELPLPRLGRAAAVVGGEELRGHVRINRTLVLHAHRFLQALGASSLPGVFGLVNWHPWCCSPAVEG